MTPDDRDSACRVDPDEPESRSTRPRTKAHEEAPAGLAGDDPAARDRAGAGDRHQGASSSRRSTSRRSRWSRGWSRTTGSWSRRSPTGAAARPQRGDVVVFKDPGGWLERRRVAGADQPGRPRLMAKIGLYPTGGHLVKRVIGVGGDTRSSAATAKGRITVNGMPLDEKSYLKRDGRVQRPDDRLATGRRSGARGPRLGDGRQPRQLRRLHACTCAATPGGGLRAGRRLVVGKVFVLLWPLAARSDGCTAPTPSRTSPTPAPVRRRRR